MEEHGRKQRTAHVRLCAGTSQARGKGGAVIYSLKRVIIFRRYFQTLYVKDIFKYQIVF